MPARDLTATLHHSGHNIVRAIIASYFLAVGLALIPGTDAVVLMERFLPEPYATLAGRGIVVFGALIVITGLFLRLSALLLAILVFWSSFLQNAESDPGAFWRDIALIAALILTYLDAAPRLATRRALFRFAPKVRRLGPGSRITPRRPSPVAPRHPSRPAVTDATANAAETTEEQLTLAL